MHQFEVGDRVRITNPNLIHFGKTGVIAAYCEIMCESAWLVRVDGTDDSCQYKDASLTPASDLITIDRADLPEVVAAPAGHYLIAGEMRGKHATAEGCRESALISLALAEFLEERDKAAAVAEMEAAARLTKRRDELAEAVAKNAGWSVWAGTEYADHQREAQEAIDLLIEFEDSRGAASDAAA